VKTIERSRLAVCTRYAITRRSAAGRIEVDSVGDDLLIVVQRCLQDQHAVRRSRLVSPHFSPRIVKRCTLSQLNGD
jgi:hypothetical protein